MAIIRPQLPQPLPPTARPAQSDARAAFFQAALAKTQPTAAVMARPMPTPQQPARQAAPEPDPTTPYRRPGSLLDIKV